ncbi:hypothetical protein [Azotobacter salinestris]|uniref:hypothetical protein n=1 Tax=Azotobacter salinestris TaxID=69964 RepID=UPI0032DEA090
MKQRNSAHTFQHNSPSPSCNFPQTFLPRQKFPRQYNDATSRGCHVCEKRPALLRTMYDSFSQAHEINELCPSFELKSLDVSSGMPLPVDIIAHPLNSPCGYCLCNGIFTTLKMNSPSGKKLKTGSDPLPNRSIRTLDKYLPGSCEAGQVSDTVSLYR